MQIASAIFLSKIFKYSNVWCGIFCYLNCVCVVEFNRACGEKLCKVTDFGNYVITESFAAIVHGDDDFGF